jgi:hypothetical protein
VPDDWGDLVLTSDRPTGRVLPGDAAAWVRFGAPSGD